jgi:hypothetical protein
MFMKNTSRSYTQKVELKAMGKNEARVSPLKDGKVHITLKSGHI